MWLSNMPKVRVKEYPVGWAVESQINYCKTLIK